jgi:glycerol-3-phosphate dehydrogenase
VEKRIPALKKGKVSGGVLYHDGQFDDSRLAIDLVKTAHENGALVLNYAEVISLLKEDGKVAGVKVRDNETGKVYDVKARCVINATGVFSNEIIRMDNPDEGDLVKPSQGVHLVLDKSFLGGDHALMIPKTSDGRVLFAVPWHDKVVVGTTDTPMDASKIEPVALEKEISFILDTAGQYLAKQPKRSDVLSVFAGLRPLAAPKKETNKTKVISRSHKIIREKSGLITIIGGKWTTYRQMAEDTIDCALRNTDIPMKPCVTKDYKIQEASDVPHRLLVYGKSAKDVERLIASSPEMGEKLHPNYDYTKGEVVWIVRNEMPRSVEDVLARRFRALFLDARAAVEMAPAVADIMAAELGKYEQWKEKQIEDFKNVAANYVLN